MGVAPRTCLDDTFKVVSFAFILEEMIRTSAIYSRCNPSFPTVSPPTYPTAWLNPIWFWLSGRVLLRWACTGFGTDPYAECHQSTMSLGKSCQRLRCLSPIQQHSATPRAAGPSIRSNLPTSRSPATSPTASRRSAEGDWNGVALMMPKFLCVIPLCHRVR